MGWHSQESQEVSEFLQNWVGERCLKLEDMKGLLNLQLGQVRYGFDKIRPSVWRTSLVGIFFQPGLPLSRELTILDSEIMTRWQLSYFFFINAAKFDFPANSSRKRAASR